MTNVTQALNTFQQLASCRLVAVTNQSGTYYNGPFSNGVGATFTYATGALTIDSVAVVVGDRILFTGQTSAISNGIWECIQAGATGVSAIFQRAGDFQCVEQMTPGKFVYISAGTVNAGASFVVVEPVVSAVGVGNIVFASMPLNSSLGTASTKAASDNTKATVASVSAATVSGNLAKFSDTAGTVADAGARIISNTTAAFGGGSAGFVYTATGLTASSKGSAVIRASTNAASILSALPGNDTLTIAFSVDPGAGTTVDYIYTTVAQS